MSNISGSALTIFLPAHFSKNMAAVVYFPGVVIGSSEITSAVISLAAFPLLKAS